MKFDLFLKVIAFIIFVVIGAIIGSSFSYRLRTNYILCVVIRRLLQKAEFLVGYRYDDIFVICRDLKNDSELAQLEFLKSLPDHYESGMDFRFCWEKAVKSQKLSSDEEQVLLCLGNIIGRSDGASQLNSISSLEVSIENIEKRRNDEYLKKGRLYRSLGVLVGLMLGILII